MSRGRISLWTTTLVLFGILLAPVTGVSANHEPIYKAGLDTLNPGEWEAHFVWLRSPHFNFIGEVWWRVLVVEGAGTVDVLFVDWAGFQTLQGGEDIQPLVQPLSSVASGYGWKSGLTHELPYFLVIQNPGSSRVQVMWAIFTELDYRRWQGQEPGPTLTLVPMASSPPLGPDDSWEMTFSAEGLYVVHTEPIIDNTGIVEVTSSLAPGPAVDVTIRDLGFHPEVIRIPAGTTVRWTNLDDFESTLHLGSFDEELPRTTPNYRSPVWWLLLPLSIGAVVALTLSSIMRRKPREDPPLLQSTAPRIKHK